MLSKRTLAQENISTVLLKIEAAETDVAIISAYQSATSSLKSLLADPRLQIDQVEDTMDQLQNAIADQKEIEDIITEGGNQVAGLGAIEDEIKEELRIMQEEADMEKARKREEEEIKKRKDQQKSHTPHQVRLPEQERLHSISVPSDQTEESRSEQIPAS